MSNSLAESTVVEYTEIAGQGDHRAALRLVDGLMADGFDVPDLLLRLLTPSQIEVGRRWQDGEWTVAKEHAATAVTGRVLSRLAVLTEERPVLSVRLIVAMAESDWHSTGASVMSIGLRHAGYEVFKAPSGTSAGQLAALVHDVGPAAVVLNCSVPSLLPGARRLVVAAQDAGTPVIAGGRAFGGNPNRARLIGANGWAGDVTAGADVVREHAGFSNPSHRFEHGATSDYARIRQRLATITETLRVTLSNHVDPTDEALELALFLLRSLAASLLIHDETILEEDLAWSAARHSRGGPPVDPAISAIRAALPDDTPTAISFFESATSQLSSSMGGKYR